MGRRTSKKNEEKLIKEIQERNEVWFGRLEEMYQPIVEDFPSTFKKPIITGYCSICQQILIKVFPKDYPDEFKFCCFCQKNALLIARGTILPSTVRQTKIYNKITLVKGNGKY